MVSPSPRARGSRPAHVPMSRSSRVSGLVICACIAAIGARDRTWWLVALFGTAALAHAVLLLRSLVTGASSRSDQQVDARFTQRMRWRHPVLTGLWSACGAGLAVTAALGFVHGVPHLLRDGLSLGLLVAWCVLRIVLRRDDLPPGTDGERPPTTETDGSVADRDR